MKIRGQTNPGTVQIRGQYTNTNKIDLSILYKKYRMELHNYCEIHCN